MNFRQKVEQIISLVPEGKVTTYGDIAAICGQPQASRIVGGIAHYGDPDLPWHRLVNRFGGLASGFPGGRSVQEALLANEGVDCKNHIVIDLEARRWAPYL